MPTDANKRRATVGKVGRPPAGDGGECVKDYPQLSIRLPRSARDKLVALSKITRQPQWRVVAESVEAYVRELPRAEQIRIARFVARTRRVQP